MNRYPVPQSKATSQTKCQKCLKLGHYSYECTILAQHRPYVSRPSRTQQLLNPKLVPKLMSDVPNALLKKKGIADEQLAKAAEERGRKRKRLGDSGLGHLKRSRSDSSSSFASIATVSTNLSRSPARPPSKVPRGKEQVVSKNRDKYTLSQAQSDMSQRERRHRSQSSMSYSSDEPGRRYRRYGSKERNTRQRRSSFSPAHRGRAQTRSLSRVGYAERTARSRSSSLDNDRIARRNSDRRYRAGIRDGRTGKQSPRRDSSRQQLRDPLKGLRPENQERPPREKSLSPFSKRLALTSAMNSRA